MEFTFKAKFFTSLWVFMWFPVCASVSRPAGMASITASIHKAAVCVFVCVYALCTPSVYSYKLYCFIPSENLLNPWECSITNLQSRELRWHLCKIRDSCRARELLREQRAGVFAWPIKIQFLGILVKRSHCESLITLLHHPSSSPELVSNPSFFLSYDHEQFIKSYRLKGELSIGWFLDFTWNDTVELFCGGDCVCICMCTNVQLSLKKI